MYGPLASGNIPVNERVEFVDSLKSRHLHSGTVILDLVKKSFVKNRTGHNVFDDFIDHLRTGTNAQKFQHLLEITGLAETYAVVVPEEDEISDEYEDESTD
jgi:hypothetical protein